MAVLWHFALFLSYFIGTATSQSMPQTTANGFLQDSEDLSDSEFLKEVNKELEGKLDPEVLEELKEWNEDIVSKLDLQVLLRVARPFSQLKMRYLVQQGLSEDFESQLLCRKLVRATSGSWRVIILWDSSRW